MLVLDDVLSELDPRRCEALLRHLPSGPGRADDRRGPAGGRAPRRNCAHRSWHGDVVSRDPVPLGDSLNAVIRSLRNDASGARVVEPDGRRVRAVGRGCRATPWPAHVKPVKLDGTKLVVEVDDPAWATQLRFLETTLKQRLLEVAGATIETIEARVRRF